MVDPWRAARDGVGAGDGSCPLEKIEEISSAKFSRIDVLRTPILRGKISKTEGKSWPIELSMVKPLKNSILPGGTAYVGHLIPLLVHYVVYEKEKAVIVLDVRAFPGHTLDG